MTDHPIIAAFDVETTGKNPAADQIIELSILVAPASRTRCTQQLHSGQRYHRRFRPDVPVSPGAEAVHGITMADLANCPRFADEADAIEALLSRADILMGYNVGFDIRFLKSEFERLDRSLNLDEKPVVDPLRIWHTMEPRRLENAYERFVGGSLDSAHSAEADTRAVAEVVDGMRSHFGLENASWQELASMTSPDRALWVGASHHIRWEAGHVVFGFGKYEGRPVFDVAELDDDYLRWIQEANFPLHVRNVCKGAASGITRQEFMTRIVAYFGQPDSAVIAS